MFGKAWRRRVVRGLQQHVACVAQSGNGAAPKALKDAGHEMHVCARGEFQRNACVVESRLERGKAILYVEYLGVAPWNQRELIEPASPEVAGLGTLLLAVSVRLSRRLGADGRLGLHSLSRVQTTSFYEARGFVSEGLKSTGDLPDIYFELPLTRSLELERKLGLSP